MKHRSNTHPTVKYSQMNSVPKLFSCSYADCWTEKHFSTEFGVLTPIYIHSHTLFWGCVSRWFGRALAWHARGHRFDPGNLHQKSTILRRKYGAFLFAEAGFGDCIASPAPFSGFCRRFLYNLQFLTLHCFQKGMFAARLFSRLLHHPFQCTA